MSKRTQTEKKETVGRKDAASLNKDEDSMVKVKRMDNMSERGQTLIPSAYNSASNSGNNLLWAHMLTPSLFPPMSDFGDLL